MSESEFDRVARYAQIQHNLHLTVGMLGGYILSKDNSTKFCSVVHKSKTLAGIKSYLCGYEAGLSKGESL
jgi:hypothetical protein